MTVVRSRVAAARHCARLLPEARLPCARAGGRDAQGRPERGCRHVHGAGLGAHRHSGARGRRDDRRDHAARRGAADRRSQGEAARGAPRRHQDCADSGGEPQGSCVDIPKNIRESLDIRPVRWIDQVLEAALERKPAAAR